jgi:Ca-activated chloride channel family protein
MNFASPQRLILIIAPIALLIAYLIVLRARQKYVVRFTSVDLLASVAPRRPGWQRHIAAGLLLLALLAMVVGFAEPTHAIKVPRKRATIMVVIDTSGSMKSTDVAPTRVAAAQQAARQFVSRLPAGIEVGLVSFSQYAKLNVAPTVDHNQTLAGINSLRPGGATATANAIQLALSAVKADQQKSSASKKNSAEIVLLSDGTPTVGLDGLAPDVAVAQEIAAAKQAKVRIDTISFGTDSGTVNVSGEQVPVPADPAAMQAIASGTGGKTYSAASLDELSKVYETIRRTVGYDSKQGSLTVWFIGAALVIACAAAACALVWSQRML